MLSGVFLILGVLDAIASGINTIIGLFTGAAAVVLEFIQGLLGAVIYVLIYLPLSYIVIFLHSILLDLTTQTPVPRDDSGDISIMATPDGGSGNSLSEFLSVTAGIADGYMEPIAILIVLIGIGLVLFFRIFDVVIEDMDYNAQAAQKKLILAPVLIFLWIPLANIILSLAFALTNVFLGMELDPSGIESSVNGDIGGYLNDDNTLSFSSLIQSIGPDGFSIGGITSSSLIAVVMGIVYIINSIPIYIVGVVLAMLRLFLLYLLYAVGPLAIAMWAFSWRDISELGKAYVRYFILLALFPIPAALVNTLLPLFILLIEAVITGGGSSNPSISDATLGGESVSITDTFGIGKVVRAMAIVFTPLVVTFGPWAFVVGLGKAMAAAGVTAAAGGAIATGGTSLAASAAAGSVKSAASTVQEKGAKKAATQAASSAKKKAGSGLRKAKKPARTAYDTYQSDDESLARQMGRREKMFESSAGDRLRSAGNTAGELVGLREGKTASQRLGGSIVSGIESAEDVKRGIDENKEQLTKAMSNSRALRSIPGGGVVQGMARYSQQKDEVLDKRDAVMAKMHEQKVKGSEIRDSNEFLEDHLENDEVASIARDNLTEQQKELVKAEEKAAAQNADGILKNYMRSMGEDPSLVDEMNADTRASLFDNALTNAREHKKQSDEDLTMADAMDEVYGEGMGDEFTSAFDLSHGDVLEAADNEGKIFSEVKERYMGEDGHGMLQSEYHQSYEDSMTAEEKEKVQSAKSEFGEVKIDGDDVHMAELMAQAHDKRSLSGVATSLGIDGDELENTLADNFNIDESELDENESVSGKIMESLREDSSDYGDALVKGIVENKDEEVSPEDSLSSVVVENIEQDPQQVADEAKTDTQVKETVERETKETVEREVTESGVAVNESNVAEEFEQISGGSDVVEQALADYLEDTIEKVEEGATAKLEEMDGQSASEIAERAANVAEGDVEEFENEIQNALEESEKVDVLSSADAGKLEQTRRNMLENFSNEIMKDMDRVNMDTLDTEVKDMDPKAKKAVKDMQQEINVAVSNNMSEIQRSMSEAARDAVENRAGKSMEEITDGVELLRVMDEVNSSGEADLASEIDMIERDMTGD